MEKKYTQGEWYVERTSSPEGDFQGRVMCNTQLVECIAGQPRPKSYIIVGEPTRKNGHANIHVEANAKLIAAAPDLLEACNKLIKQISFKTGGEYVNEDGMPINNNIAVDMIQKAIKKATE